MFYVMSCLCFGTVRQKANTTSRVVLRWRASIMQRTHLTEEETQASTAYHSVSTLRSVSGQAAFEISQHNQNTSTQKML